MRILTWTPGYALFAAPFEAGNLEVDIQRFGRAMRGQLEPEPKSIVVGASHHDIARLVRTGQPIAVDIETAPATKDQPWTGKDPTQAQLKTIGFGTVDEGISLHWESADEWTRLMVAEVLADRAIKKVFHNGPYFDIRVLQRYGLEVNHFDDTRAMRRVLSSTSRLSLRHLASMYCDIHNWKDAEQEEDDEKLWASTDLNKLMKYNALDCIVTAKCYAAMRAEWRDE